MAQTLANLGVERSHQFGEAINAGLLEAAKEKSDYTSFLSHLIVVTLTQDSEHQLEDMLRASNTHKAALLEQASALFQDIIDDDFDLSGYSDVWRDKILEFQTKTRSD